MTHIYLTQKAFYTDLTKNEQRLAYLCDPYATKRYQEHAPVNLRQLFVPDNVVTIQEPLLKTTSLSR